MLCSLYSLSPNQGPDLGVVRGGRDRHFFFEILYYFYRILRKIKSVYKAGKCPSHPFLNFLDSPLLMFAIMCAGKSTTPLA